MSGRDQWTELVRAAERRRELSDAERDVLLKMGDKPWPLNQYADDAVHDAICSLARIGLIEFTTTPRERRITGAFAGWPPTWWLTTDAGRAALAEHQGDE